MSQKILVFQSLFVCSNVGNLLKWRSKYETTINIRANINGKINRDAQLKGISRSELIAILIEKVMDDISNPGRIGRLVQYQERRSHGAWYTFHFYLKEDEYEYFQGIRKLLKMLVSLILAYAVEKFLDMIIRRNNTDNNRYQNYVIIKEIIDDLICWKFIWS